MKKNNLELLKQEKIVAIIRGIPSDLGLKTAEALLNGGVKFVEVTLNTEGALNMITEIKEQFGHEMHVGAGTVLDISMAKDAISAGAEYLVSPNLDERVIDLGVSQDVDVWPGTLTPTEIVRAYQAGATAVKVFPIGAFGVNYLKDIRGPINHIPMMATGGVNLNNMNDFLQAGAVAVGLGGNLVNNALIKEHRFEEITDLARQFVTKREGV